MCAHTHPDVFGIFVYMQSTQCIPPWCISQQHIAVFKRMSIVELHVFKGILEQLIWHLLSSLVNGRKFTNFLLYWCMVVDGYYTFYFYKRMSADAVYAQCTVCLVGQDAY